MKKNILALLVALIVPVVIVLLMQETSVASSTNSNLIHLHQQPETVRSHQESLAQYAGKGYTILDFYADWCPPCQRMSPIFEAVARLMPQFTFIKINRDFFLDLAGLYNITGIPTLIFLHNGKEIGRYEAGPLTEKKLQQLITKTFRNA
jgi:thiol-disulfide isomerase/thioredoxin